MKLRKDSMDRKAWLVTKMPTHAVSIVKDHKKQGKFKYIADALTDLIIKGSSNGK